MEVVCLRAAVLILLVSASLVIPASPIVVGIEKRNDEYVPQGGVTVNTSTLLNYLETLRKLNDSNVDNYVYRIEYALNHNNTEEANKLLNELQSYLDSQYHNGTGRPEIDKAIAFVSSVERVQGNEALVDLLQYAEMASRLLNDPKMREVALRLGSGKLSEGDMKYLEKIMGAPLSLKPSRSAGFPSPGAFPGMAPGTGKLPEVKPPSLAPLPSVPAVPASPSASSAYLSLILYVILLGVIGYLIYKYRGLMGKYLRPVREGVIRRVFVAASMLRGAKDPAAALYRRWLAVARSRGYRRYLWETPREFLLKIRDADLRTPGELATRIYEERFYGGRTLPAELLERARRLLGGGRSEASA